MTNNQILLMLLVVIVIAIVVIYVVSKIIRNKIKQDGDDHEMYAFAIHFKQILKRIDDYENVFYEHPKPKYRMYQVYFLIIAPLCFAILIAYNIFISISVIIFMGYGYCFIKFYKLWKLYGYSKLLYWTSSIGLLVISAIIAPYIRMGIMYLGNIIMNR